MRCHPYFGDRTWWLVEGDPLPPPSGHCWPHPVAWWNYSNGWIGIVDALRGWPLDPTKADA